MKLRELRISDAPLMLEWMQDEEIAQSFKKNFSSYTLEQVEAFIKESNIGKENKHYAIASDEDEYMGTVTIKNIDYENGHAELAIVTRKVAMKCGYAWFGMKSILDKAFDELNLQSVYWCVRKDCERPIVFFDKHGFKEVIDLPARIRERYRGETNLKWYAVIKGDAYGDDSASLEGLDGCRMINIRSIPTIDAGKLSFFEPQEEIGFGFKRIYYITNVPEGKRRGYHAHRKLKQVLFCPYGKIEIRLDNTEVHKEVILSDPSRAIVIEKPLWREMLWLQKDSVLCVLASEYYDETDYIRDYKEFEDYIKGLAQ